MSQFETFTFGVPWEDAASYAQAVRADRLLLVSGQLSHDADGAFVGEGDFATQISTSFANLDRVLEHFGTGRDRIAEVNLYVVDLRPNFAGVAEACQRYFGDLRPANNVLGVAALAFPQQLVEISATVALED